MSRVVPHQKLMEAVRELADEIAAGPPVAHRLTKHLVQAPLRRAYDEHLPYQLYALNVNRSLGGHDLEEGLQAFFEKRTPRFEGLAGRRRKPGAD